MTADPARKYRPEQLDHPAARGTLKVTAVAAGLACPHAAQAIQVVRRRKLKGKWSCETCYPVTSLTVTQATCAQLATFIRGHWGIEDRLHWIRGLDFDERPLPGPHRGRPARCGRPARPGHDCLAAVGGGRYRRRRALPCQAACPAASGHLEGLAGVCRGPCLGRPHFAAALIKAVARPWVKVLMVEPSAAPW
jgi:hypothetical protein